MQSVKLSISGIESSLNHRRFLYAGTILAAVASIAIYKYFERRKSREKYSDLPDWTWIKGHRPHLTKFDGTGKAFQFLSRSNSEGAAYFRLPWGVKHLMIFRVEQLQEIFFENGDKSSGRNPFLEIHENFDSNRGILEYEGTMLAMKRQTFLGVSKIWKPESQFQLVFRESQYLTETLELKGTEIEPYEILRKAVANAISTFIFGSRFDYADEEAERAFGAISNFNKRDTYGPRSLWLLNSFWPTDLDMSKSKEGIKTLKSFITEKIERRVNEGIKNPAETLIDAFVGCQMEKDDLICTIYELFFAGIETTVSTLLWFIACVSKYPDVQLKMVTEITKIVGDSELTSDHVRRLHYTRAVKQEVLRYGAIAQNTIRHRMTDDVRTTSGKVVKKGETVFASLYTIMRDPRHFEQPDEFYPEHFLDESGHLKSNPAYQPFGIGPRGCLGKTLASTQIEIYMIQLVRTFKISCNEEIDLNRRVQKLVSVPYPRKYRFSRR